MVVGVFLLFSPTAFSSRREVLEIGGLRVSAEEGHPITPWIASALLIAGVALVHGAVRRKTKRLPLG